MTFKELKNKIKEEQKTLAQNIKTGKPLRKPKNWNAASEEERQLYFKTSSWEYRHRHIVYCQFFNNTPYHMIEQPREGNHPDDYFLKKYRTEWENELDEDVYHSA